MTNPSELDPDYVRDISLAFYLDRLGPDGTKTAATKFEGGEAEFYKVMRSRAASYDSWTKAYLRAIQANPITSIPQPAPASVKVNLDPTPYVLEETPRKAATRGRKGNGYTPKQRIMTK